MEQTEDNRWSVGCDAADEPACMGYQSFTTFARQRDAREAWNRRANAYADLAAAVEHANVRFQCVADEAKERGDNAGWAMASVDADRMAAALAKVQP